MSIKSQGTNLYFVDPDSGDVNRLVCPSGITGIGGTIGEEDVTCLEAEGAEFAPAEADGGTVTVSLRFDPRESSHRDLRELFEDLEDRIEFAVGLSDGDTAPTWSSSGGGEWTLPSSRSWLTFAGYISEFSIDIETNARVEGDVSIRVSGGLPKFTAKTGGG